MRNVRLTFGAVVCFISILTAQNSPVNKYGLNVISSKAVYESSISKDSSNELVNLKRFIPSIQLDIKYATKKNFTGKRVYSSAQAFLRLPAAAALRKVQNELKKMGMGLKIFDAYRPYSATVKFYEIVKDSTYAASPWSGSRHNRGCAVDLTLVRLKSGKELPMPTGFDSFSEKAHSDYLNLPPDEIRNRDLLIGVMAKYGFENLPSEWWHYDFKDWNKFEIMDLSFEELER